LCGTSASAAKKRFAFIFPMASGHINPSLPLARMLVHLGHEVHYLCREQMRTAIEDTGAKFHAEIEQKPELYKDREADLFGASEALKQEYGLQTDKEVLSRVKLHAIAVELHLPGLMRWLHQVQADAVVYCPLINTEVEAAARVLGLPSVALLTTAGPGSVPMFWRTLLEGAGTSAEEVVRLGEAFEPRRAAEQRLLAEYELDLDEKLCLAPFGKMAGLRHNHVTIVTTTAELQDPMSKDLQTGYQADGVRFAFVGPLLDQAGAKRAAGHKLGEHSGSAAAQDSSGEVLELVRIARKSQRAVILASMGTVITGDSPQWGWDARGEVRSDSIVRGLTGRELCRAAWAGTFKAFGTAAPDEGALILVALGPQPDALGPLVPPPNAICVPSLPQVDILKAGVDLFLTHGGQNSFMEALSTAVPVVVCPGFGDQPVNAAKAVEIGVGLKVDRPAPVFGQEGDAVARYSADVTAALTEVQSSPRFKASVARCAASLREAGGVPRAVEIVLEAAAARGAAPGSAGKVPEARIDEKGARTKIRSGGA